MWRDRCRIGSGSSEAHILRWVVRYAEELARRWERFELAVGRSRVLLGDSRGTTPVAACPSREPPAGSFPGLLLHHPRAVLDRRRLPSVNPALRLCYRLRIVPQRLRNQVIRDPIELRWRHLVGIDLPQQGAAIDEHADLFPNQLLAARRGRVVPLLLGVMTEFAEPVQNSLAIKN